MSTIPLPLCSEVITRLVLSSLLEIWMRWWNYKWSKRNKDHVSMWRRYEQGRALRALLLPSQLTCAALTQLSIKVLPMSCALSGVLIKASFLIYRMAWSKGLWGERDFLPIPPSLTLTRWFCWAPVTSHWPNRRTHWFFSSSHQSSAFILHPFVSPNS